MKIEKSLNGSYPYFLTLRCETFSNSLNGTQFAHVYQNYNLFLHIFTIGSGTDYFSYNYSQSQTTHYRHHFPFPLIEYFNFPDGVKNMLLVHFMLLNIKDKWFCFMDYSNLLCTEGQWRPLSIFYLHNGKKNSTHFNCIFYKYFLV